MTYRTRKTTGAPLAAAAVFYSGGNLAAAKKVLIFVTLSLCLGAAAYGTPVWKLNASYPTPGPNPRGYSSGGPPAGFIVMDGSDPSVYYYSWEQSSVLSSFPAPGGSGAWGIAHGAGAGLMITNNLTSWIYETTTQGSVVNSFRCPLDGPADCGFAWPGFIVAIPDQNIIAVLNRSTGSLISTYPGPGSRPTGCGGYAHFYVADAGTHTIYEDGVPIITGIQAPVGFGYVWSTAPPYDIELFVVDDATDRYFYYARASEVRVYPASLGRVKALFQ